NGMVTKAHSAITTPMDCLPMVSGRAGGLASVGGGSTAVDMATSRTVGWLRLRYRSLPRLSRSRVRIALDAGTSRWVTLIRAIGRGVIGNTFAFGANVPGSSPGGRAV